MKKKYILLPLIFIAVLAAIIVCVAVALNTRYLKKLSYDHMDGRVYNGVEVVGDDGLFYLVKDGKKVSDGYASLQSVNDYYSTSLERLAADGKKIVLFDYYLARSAENSGYLLVSSEGDEFVIAGDSYSLDTESTSLPYLVFTNNANGLKAVVSLYRLDSDISYRSGNELTLRTFKEVTPLSVCDDEPLCAYLKTSDVSDTEQISYFRHDGIKISTGKDVSVLTLRKENEERDYPFFYNSEDGRLTTLGGELVASDISEIINDGREQWGYALCHNAEKSVSYAVVFTPDRYFTVSSETYDIPMISSFGNCLVAHRADGKGTDVINVMTAKTANYVSVSENLTVLVASDRNGAFNYLNGDGACLMTCAYADMIPDVSLSTENCHVFSSVSYNAGSGSDFLHFARAGAEVYTLNVGGLIIERLDDAEHAAYRVTATENGKTVYAVLAPFSAIKTSQYYDSAELYTQNGVSFVLAASYTRGAYDIIDPLTAKAVSSFTCAPEDFSKLSFSHIDNIALATDMRDESTAVHMSIITLSRYDTDDIKSGVRYFAVYRCAPIADDSFKAAALKVQEIGEELLLDAPYRAFTSKNYLITYTATGSEIFSLDEYFELARIASLPYHAVNILPDLTSNGEDYFLVQTDSGMRGLYNRDSEAVLAPYYSEILHAEDGYFVVGMRGAYGVIRSTASGAKTVIDFLYSKIEPLGDNGYLAVNGEGETVIYSGKKMIMSESVQSVDSVHSYTVDEEGRLSVSEWALISVKGSLYIHRSESAVRLSFGIYEGCDISTDGELNERAMTIYYYDGAELLHTEVIYPNGSLDSLYGNAEGKVWYIYQIPAEQTAPVTADDLLGRKIVKLYAQSK